MHKSLKFKLEVFADPFLKPVQSQSPKTLCENALHINEAIVGQNQGHAGREVLLSGGVSLTGSRNPTPTTQTTKLFCAIDLRALGFASTASFAVLLMVLMTFEVLGGKDYQCLGRINPTRNQPK